MGQRGRPRHPDILTPREWEVLALLRDGLSNEAIAEALGVSLSTARFHVSEILGNLGVSSREEAARWRQQATEQEAEQAPPRRWALAAPLALARRLPHLGAGARVAAGGALALAFAAVALLAWGIMRTHGTSSDTPGHPAAVEASWQVDERDFGAPSVVVFDFAARTARRIPIDRAVGYAQWVNPGQSFVAHTTTDDGKAWGPWQLFGTDGASESTVAPAASWVDAAGDGRQITAVDAGTGTMIDATTMARTTLEMQHLGLAQFSPDGTRLAFRVADLPDTLNEFTDYTDILVTGSLGAIPANGRYSAGSIKSQRAADGFLNFVSFSPDDRYVLLEREIGCAQDAPGCVNANRIAFEVYGTTLTDDLVWHDYEGMLVGAQWAGPGRLLVTFADGQHDPAYPDARQLLITLGVGKHTVPDLIAASCCMTFSRDGKFAVARVGVDADERCALFDTQTPPTTPNPNEPPGFGWTELAAIHPMAADADHGFCSYADWSPDGRTVIVSGAGN